MIALCVDDEVLPLNALARAVGKSPDIDSVFPFDDEIDALAWAEQHPVDIAFLDVQLHEINGIDLARKLAALHPDISIVFCTGYEKYAVNAIGLHMDAGYLVKPFRASQVQDEINHIKEKRAGHAPKSTGHAKDLPAGGKSIQIRMMGEFSISVDDVRSTVILTKMKKGVAFLEYLILNEGMRIPKQRLLNLFWSDYLYTNPDSAFKTLVSRLRKALSETSEGLENCIVSEDGCYYFQNLPGMSVDALQIRHLWNTLQETADPSIRETLYRRLLSLYTGDLFVPGEMMDGSEYIEELHSKYLATVEAYTNDLMQQAQYARVLEICRKAELVDPFSELIHRRIMQALEQSGRIDDAVREYERLRQLSLKHLNAEPSEGMQEYYEKLKS